MTTVANTREETIDSTKDIRIFVRSWLPESAPRAVVVICHGLHGTGDKITLQKGSEFFYQTAGSTDKTLKLYEGHYHDLLADYGKEDVMAEIKAWIDARIR